jgi:hypothetical protein
VPEVNLSEQANTFVDGVALPRTKITIHNPIHKDCGCLGTYTDASFPKHG